ncbi:hypothetical protein [Streptomyces sp. NRRL S-37]|uniref:hypothetical protein n=1 Tax=Streptomyces sp. NRRL S-37 TaxID=1463903 RepID=UPI0004C9E28F|nr:hypothetical protein [Streptomyces sp. NRRL S-37]
MTAQRPDDGGTPEERDGTPALPEDVWQRFLTDNERAIRATAPREPSALQRTRPHTGGGVPREDAGVEAVGDLWQPDDPWDGPSWREMDRRARLRRAGRVAGTAAAIALALGAWSQLSTGAGTPAEAPGDTVLQQSEELPQELPTATSRSPEPASPAPSAPGVRTG